MGYARDRWSAARGGTGLGGVTNGPDQEHSPRGAAGRAHRPLGQARDTPTPQGLPCDPQCTRPRCGQRPTYLATEQVHLYRAGTNGRPVQQSYTLTGSASTGPPKGNTRGRDLSQRQGPPPPPQPGRPGQGTRGTPPQATRHRERGGRVRKGGDWGTHHHQQTPTRGGGEPHPDPAAGAGEGPRHAAPV